MKKKQDDFEILNNLPEAARDPEITQDDFKLVTTDETIHEQKFQTKPTTFFKDCLRRFRKNKSSVVAAVILGLLLVLAIIIPAVSPYDVSADAANTGFEYLEPKLFDAGTGFWDGTRKYKDYSVDVSANPDAKTDEEKQKDWWPNETFVRSAISKKKFSDEKYTDSVTDFGKGGFIRHSMLKTIRDEDEYAELRTQEITDKLDLNTTTITITKFDTYDFDKINLLPNEKAQPIESDYTLAKVGLHLVSIDMDGDKEVKTYYEIIEPKVVHSIGSEISSMSESAVDVETALADAGISRTEFSRYYFALTIKNEKKHQNQSSMIRSLTFDVDGDQAIREKLCDYTEGGKVNNGCSFTDATASGREPYYLDDAKTKLNYAYLISDKSSRQMYMSKAYFVSFTYDTYEAKLGTKYMTRISYNDLRAWSKAVKSASNPWGVKLLRVNIDIIYSGGKYVVDQSTFDCKILDERCPLAKDLTIDDIYVDPSGPSDSNPYGFEVDGYITMYKYYGYEKMPKFLLGTDKNGKDMLKYVFDGLRWSLLLGILSSAVCFIFGLIWGAICGYFGGNVDLIMERFTDILSGIPWIVVMTLVIIHLGSTFFSFALALCLTGWIGTAATTRTQFYRFRGREYVLASRTLGASNARLIAKHILPNAMGTIITSAVLMIPGVIFSEATISYLGLGFKNLNSLGVILSNNQPELKQYPYLLIFPAVIIALLMISFNLFGNGLRDAVNPSLKGEDQ